jgi:NADPH:quinone reductase-like Zn-dependent oxidoreductase
LVRIAASGVNPLDAKIRAGAAAHARHPFPVTPGMDLAGTIEQVGTKVTEFSPGDLVYGMTGGVGGIQGTLAEFAAVDARLLAPKPRHLTMRESAAIPLVFITAWEGLVDRAAIRAGQRVLVQGGAGGVGHMAIQIAQSFGATVYATASARKREVVEKLGAIFIDYNTTPVEDYVAQHTHGNGFDLVFDSNGGLVLDASFKAVSRFGHVVSALGWGTHLLAPLSFKAASYSGVFTLYPLLSGQGREHHGHILREATRLADSGKLTPILDPREFTLDTVDNAHEAVSKGAANGKLVVNIASEPHR